MAKDNFTNCLEFTLKYEGGFVNDPHDPGGATNLGITRATLAAWRGRSVTVSEVRALARDEAAAIYRQHYWDAIGADRLPYGVDLLAFDIAVNMGVARYHQWEPGLTGLSTSEQINYLDGKRRSFWKSLKSWAWFGKGWTARENACLERAQEMSRGHRALSAKRQAGRHA